ncbi:hypothetical protein [Variovorax soli]|uniref:hypothetical protein n=1 Tax=Variovorax soli TaxID=376815 RepID=UPI000838814A|nr:hypothetical protein [Variovorax soli]
MTVLCGTCSAENRDAAKFCKGCGRKIAQAWPQAASAAPADEAAWPPAPARPAKAHEELRPMPAPPRARIGNGRWIVGLGLGVVLLVLAASWWGHRNKGQEIARPTAPVPDAPANHQPAAVEGSPPAVTDVPGPAATTPTTADTAEHSVLQEPAGAAPGPAPTAEAAAPASPQPRKPAAKKQAPSLPAPVAVEAAPPPPIPAPAPARVPTPQESCAGRNFIARAQCMAEQCARPEVARHPQCEAVRQQQRIEEEKRNPTMAG